MILCNMLLDELPTTTPNGYKIETNFRNVIKFELLMQDRGLTIEEKTSLSLQLFYNKIENIEKQIEDMIWFYQCGKNNKRLVNKIKEKKIFKFIAMNLTILIFTVHFCNNII